MGGRELDGYYLAPTDGPFKNTQQVYYKHLSGNLITASAFGFWWEPKFLRDQHITSEITLNTIKKN